LTGPESLAVVKERVFCGIAEKYSAFLDSRIACSS